MRLESNPDWQSPRRWLPAWCWCRQDPLFCMCLLPRHASPPSLAGQQMKGTANVSASWQMIEAARQGLLSSAPRSSRFQHFPQKHLARRRHSPDPRYLEHNAASRISKLEHQILAPRNLKHAPCVPWIVWFAHITKEAEREASEAQSIISITICSKEIYENYNSEAWGNSQYCEIPWKFLDTSIICIMGVNTIRYEVQPYLQAWYQSLQQYLQLY